MSAHYITKEFELRQYHLGVRELNAQHTGENLYVAINEILNEYEHFDAHGKIFICLKSVII